MTIFYQIYGFIILMSAIAALGIWLLKDMIRKHSASQVSILREINELKAELERLKAESGKAEAGEPVAVAPYDN